MAKNIDVILSYASPLKNLFQKKHPFMPNGSPWNHLLDFLGGEKPETSWLVDEPVQLHGSKGLFFEKSSFLSSIENILPV